MSAELAASEIGARSCDQFIQDGGTVVTYRLTLSSSALEAKYRRNVSHTVRTGWSIPTIDDTKFHRKIVSARA